MDKIKGFVNKNYKVVIGIIIGITISIGIGVSAVATKDIAYDNSTSGLTSTNLQEAIDEVYKKTDIRNYDNIVSAYTYNSSTCITGEESSCKKTTCYKSTASGSCKAGTIIKYKVNDTDIVTFHVMYDNGTTMTMQSQKSIIKNVAWISVRDIADKDKGISNCTNAAYCLTEGPYTVFERLISETAGWSNVNNQTFTLGTTVFKTNSYTGDSSNIYTWPSLTVKARIISYQEARNLGCGTAEMGCPKWMNNYLYNSTSYGGTVNDTSNGTFMNSSSSINSGYWTLNGRRGDSSTGGYPRAWYVSSKGNLDHDYNYNNISARAVVVVNK